MPVFELALERGETGAWVNLGLTLYDLGDIPGAMHAYAQAETAGDSGGPLNLAMLLHDHGDTDAALSAARRAADAGHPAAPAVVASWQWNTTLDPGLEQALRAGADHFPPARADLGDLLRTIGRVDEAVQVLRDGMGRGEVESMIPLANLYWDVLDDCDAAREVLTIAADHGDSHAHHNLAVLLEEHDELEVSALHYRLAIAGGDTLAIDALRDLLGD